MSRLSPYASSQSLRLAALFLVLLAALAVSLSGSGPVGATDYEPDQDVVEAVEGYSKELTHGYDHVLRWVRVLMAFGAVEDMSAAEAQGHADTFWNVRWDPVAAELTALQADPDYEPDQDVIDDVGDIFGGAHQRVRPRAALDAGAEGPGRHSGYDRRRGPGLRRPAPCGAVGPGGGGAA